MLQEDVTRLKAQLLSEEEEIAIEHCRMESRHFADQLACVVAQQETVRSAHVELNVKLSSVQASLEKGAALQINALAQTTSIPPPTYKEVERLRTAYDITRSLQMWIPLALSPTKMEFSISGCSLSLQLESESQDGPRKVTAADLQLPEAITDSAQLTTLFTSTRINLNVECRQVLEQYTDLVVHATAIVRDIQTMSLFNPVELVHNDEELSVKLKYVSCIQQTQFQLIFNVPLATVEAVPTCTIEGAVPALSDATFKTMVGVCPPATSGWMCNVQTKIHEFLSL